MNPFLRSQGVRGGSCDQKIFLPKFAPRTILGTCEVLGASEKPFFCYFKFRSRGGVKPPVAGGPLKGPTASTN